MTKKSCHDAGSLPDNFLATIERKTITRLKGTTRSILIMFAVVWPSSPASAQAIRSGR